MLIDEIKPNWAGACKDELLATPDVLPPQVRRHPRAYLVPPGESLTKRKRRDWLARHPPLSGTVASSAMSFASSPASMQHAVAWLAQSVATRPQGPIISSTIHWPTNRLMTQYSSGHTVISPDMRYAGYPLAQAMSSVVSCLHSLVKSYDTDGLAVGPAVNSTAYVAYQSCS